MVWGDDKNDMPFTTLLSAQIAEWSQGIQFELYSLSPQHTVQNCGPPEYSFEVYSPGIQFKALFRGTWVRYRSREDCAVAHGFAGLGTEAA